VPSAGTFIALDRTRHARPGGVTVFREPIPDGDVCLLGDVCLTTLERAVFDCLRVLPDVAALALLGQALDRGWSTVPQLADRMGRFTNRHGAPRLVDLINTAAHGNHSAAVRLTTRLLQGAGIWGWELNVAIHDRWGFVGMGDLVLNEPKLVISLEGRSCDPDSRRTQEEQQRHYRLLAAGWTPLAFTWHDLNARPDDVVATTKHALDWLGCHVR
jgi:hypothetical protein